MWMAHFFWHPVRQTMNLDARVQELLEPELELLGYELVLVEVVGSGQQVLRLFIDREGGVNLGDCERVSRAAEPILDEADLFTRSYRLEVSSPGVDRPLTRPEHYRRFRGARVRVSLKDGGTLRGTLRESDENGFTLARDVPGDGASSREPDDRQASVIAFSEVSRANLLWDESEGGLPRRPARRKRRGRRRRGGARGSGRP
jgi:ribosome maturation factor RimP